MLSNKKSGETTMSEETFHTFEIGKKRDKIKIKGAFPVISRTDIMSGILSTSLDRETRAKLSNLYAEITYMEKRELKYITEIAVSSAIESEIYDILKNMNKKHTISASNKVARG